MCLAELVTTNVSGRTLQFVNRLFTVLSTVPGSLQKRSLPLII